MTSPLTVARIAALLRPTLDAAPFPSVGDRAAVALVLRDGPDGAEVLLVRRAHRDGDPWSGHVSLPGGRKERGDADDRAVAARETLEEVGLDLAGSPVVGRLYPQFAKSPRRSTALVIVPVVFAYEGAGELKLSGEVTRAFWLPLAGARAGAFDVPYPWRLGRFPIALPSWRFDGETVWGMTHRIVSEMLTALRAAG